MGLGCGAKCLKYILFAFNLIFVAIGLVLLGIGVWFIVEKDDAIIQLQDKLEDAKVNNSQEKRETLENLKSHPNAVRTLGIILLVVGLILCLIAFLGCCGAITENRILLYMYAGVLVILLLVGLAAAIYGAVEKDKIQEKTKKLMSDTLEHYNYFESGKKPDTWTSAWDALMDEFKCCGVNGTISDWTETLWNKNDANSNRNANKFPARCCEIGTDSCTTDDRKYKQGCYNELEDYAKEKFTIGIIVAAVLAVLLVLGVVFSCCLAKSIDEDYN